MSVCDGNGQNQQWTRTPCFSKRDLPEAIRQASKCISIVLLMPQQLPRLKLYYYSTICAFIFSMSSSNVLAYCILQRAVVTEWELGMTALSACHRSGPLPWLWRSAAHRLLSSHVRVSQCLPWVAAPLHALENYFWEKCFQKVISEKLLILLRDRPCLELIIVSSNFQACLFLQKKLLESVGKLLIPVKRS